MSKRAFTKSNGLPARCHGSSAFAATKVQFGGASGTCGGSRSVPKTRQFGCAAAKASVHAAVPHPTSRAEAMSDGMGAACSWPLSERPQTRCWISSRPCSSYMRRRESSSVLPGEMGITTRRRRVYDGCSIPRPSRWADDIDPRSHWLHFSHRNQQKGASERNTLCYEP